jgi:hypothetical protein
MTINRLDKPRKLTGPLPLRRRTRPVTRAEQHISNVVTRRLTWVTENTPIGNEAYLSTKPA